MTQSPEIERTAAEAALSAEYAELSGKGAFAGSGGAGFLPNAAERAAAAAEFAANGLPSRKVESWHYTDLRRLLTRIAPFIAAAKEAILPPLLPDAPALAVINGKALPLSGAGGGAICAAPLAGRKEAEMPFAVLPAEERKDKGDIIATLNTMFARDGWHINVPAQKRRECAVEIQNIQNGGQAHNRFAAHIAAGARLTMLERQSGDDAASFLTSAAEVKIGAGAEVRWIILRERGAAAAELNRFQALLGAGAKLTLFIINAGCGLLRQEVNVDLAGEEADFQLRGVNLLSGRSHTDTTMVVRHLVENTASTEIFRNVVAEEARGVFQGMIRVAAEAQKTDARMACNSLILSGKAEFDAKPELEIFADDVACGHGATVAEINPDHIFYLMARGIPEGQARALLIKAFVGELIDELPNGLAETLHKALETWLKRHFHTAAA